MKKVEIHKIMFQCDFCNYRNDVEFHCKEHEKTCPYNPKNKTCHTCKHWVFEESFGDVDLDHCNAYNKNDLYKKNCPKWNTELKENKKEKSDG